MDSESQDSRPPTKRTRVRDAHKTIAVLKKAAREQLVTKGINGASVQPILDRAGVSRGALFHHFPTKNHLIAAAYDELMRDASVRLRALSVELRLSIIDIHEFVVGLRAIYCSDVFTGSMDVALSNRVEPAMTRLIQGTLERWWVTLSAFWNDTFALPGRTAGEVEQHWVMAANLLRGHAFTTIYRNSDAIQDDFCASFRQMVLTNTKIHAFEDSFEALAADLEDAVGHRLFTALAVSFPYVERVYSTRPDVYPMGGRKRMDTLPWGDHVIEKGEPWLGRDAEDLKQMFPDYQTIESIGCGSCLNLPVKHGGTTIGSLNILDVPNAYTPDDTATAALFSRRAAHLFLTK